MSSTEQWVHMMKSRPDGSTVELQRFISNLVLMNAYFRRLRGDSSLLPPVSRLGLLVLDENETLEVDWEDTESAFNLFRMPKKKSLLILLLRWP